VYVCLRRPVLGVAGVNEIHGIQLKVQWPDPQTRSSKSTEGQPVNRSSLRYGRTHAPGGRTFEMK
jgi:hypothetical protein